MWRSKKKDKTKESKSKESGDSLALYDDDNYYSDRYNRMVRKYDRSYYDSWGFSSYFNKSDEESELEVVIPVLDYDTRRRLEDSVEKLIVKFFHERKNSNRPNSNYTFQFDCFMDYLKSNHPGAGNFNTSKIHRLANFFEESSKDISLSVIKNKHKSRDLFKLYYNKDIVFDDKDQKKAKWLETLMMLDAYYMKVSTNGSYLYSSSISKHIIKNMIYEIIFYLFNDKDKETQNKESDGKTKMPSSKEISEAIEAIMGSSSGFASTDNMMFASTDNMMKAKELPDKDSLMQNLMKKSIDEANDDHNNIKSVLDLYGVKEDDMKGNEIEDLVKMLEGSSNSINKEMLSDFIKKRMAGMTKAMSSCEHFRKTIPIEFIESDDMSNFDYYESLIEHSLLNEAESHEHIHTMKYDIYIDISGSMNGMINVGKSNIKLLLYAKILAIKMIGYNIVGDIYSFNDYVEKREHSDNKESKIKSVVKLCPNGGTSFVSVTDRVEKTKRPSLIITDGQSTFGSNKIPHVYVMQIGGNASGVDYVKQSECGRDILRTGRYCIVTSNGKAIYPKLND